MAFGPSLYFVAPNWEPNVLRSSEPNGNSVPGGPFRSWLRNLGFVQHPGPGNNYTLDTLDLFVYQVDEEVAFTTVEFGLANDAPARITAWQAFAEALCEKWDFSLTDEEKKVPVEEFRRILAQHRLWRIISDVHRWPPIWPEPLQSHTSNGGTLG